MFEAMKILKAANPQQYIAAERRRLSALAVRPAPAADRAAHQGGRRTRDRVRRRRRLGHAREPGRRDGPARAVVSTTSRSRSRALVADLGDRMADVTILTMSEFGRTARQNGNGGTDHGHASAMFVIGGDVKGKKVHGKWPGLEPEQLYEGRDLALTTDFRSVFSEVAFKHLGAAKMDAVFPGFKTIRRIGWGFSRCIPARGLLVSPSLGNPLGTDAGNRRPHVARRRIGERLEERDDLRSAPPLSDPLVVAVAHRTTRAPSRSSRRRRGSSPATTDRAPTDRML